jgi:DNA-binding CsgD family transcriptional regulator
MVAIEVRSPVYLSRSGPRSGLRDFVSIVDAAYDLGASEADWLKELCFAIEPVLGRGLGAFAFLYDLGDQASALTVRSPTFLNCSPQMYATMCEGAQLVTSEQLSRAYSGFPCQSLSQCHSHGTRDYPGFKPAKLVEHRAGVRDLLIVRAAHSPATGCAIAVPTAQVTRFASRTAGVMAKVARHIAVAWRLRQRITFVDARPALDVEAVLTDSGRVVHAEGHARNAKQRTMLSTAVRLLAQNKARFRTTHPEQVVRLWTALIDGQWSIVDSIDSDGKRHLLARRNTPELTHPNALQPVERHVAALVAMGNPIKLGAYELGLPVAAVSATLASALRRLRVRSRAELVQIFSQRTAASCQGHEED